MSAWNTNEYIWNLKFRISVQERELEYYRNGNKFKKLKGDYESLCRGDAPLDGDTVKRFEDEYDLILGIAKEEYADDPPSDYYRDGYNLYRRLVEYKESELLFLHDKNVPLDNSLAGRLARYISANRSRQSYCAATRASKICALAWESYIL